MVHGHKNLGHTMHAQSMWHSVLGGVGYGMAGKDTGKQRRLVGEKQLFCGGGQAQSSQAVVVISTQQPFPFESLDDRLFVRVRAR